MYLAPRNKNDGNSPTKIRPPPAPGNRQRASTSHKYCRRAGETEIVRPSTRNHMPQRSLGHQETRKRSNHIHCVVTWHLAEHQAAEHHSLPKPPQPLAMITVGISPLWHGHVL